MSIRAFYGFDGVGQGVQGSSGDAATAPVNGVGITATRNQPLTVKLHNPTAPQYNAAGVTGLEQHKVGKAGERRNALVLYRYSYAISFTAGATVNLLEKFEGRTNKPWRSVVGFTWSDFSAQEPTVAYWLARASRGNSYFNLIQRRNYGALTINNVDFPIERNREYYIEVEMFCDTVVPGRSSNPTSCRVWIDGQVVGEWIGSFGSYSTTTSTPMGLEVGFVAHPSNPIAMYMGIADVYVVDGEGEAPYNDRMGPQKARFIPVGEVTPELWETTGAEDAQAALSDPSDATYIQSPLTEKASGVLLFDLGLNSKSVLNGVQVYGRGSRGNGAQRPIASSLRVGSQFVRPNTNNFGPAPTDALLTSYMPDKTSDMAVLQGSALSTLEVKVEA